MNSKGIQGGIPILFIYFFGIPFLIVVRFLVISESIGKLFGLEVRPMKAERGPRFWLLRL